MIYAEPIAATNFSFLRGASHPAEMVETALALGIKGVGIADRNSVAGVVRAWSALERAREEGRGLDFKLITGARLVFADDTPDIVAYPTTRAAWSRLTQLLSLGNLRGKKGQCILHFADLLEACEEMALIFISLRRPNEQRQLEKLKAKTQHLWIGATMHRAGRDTRQLAALGALSLEVAIPLIATNDALYATPEARPLHDILTCIAEKTTIHKAGHLLSPNAERHLKPPSKMARLFAKCPDAILETHRLFAAVNFDLSHIAYEYPHEPVPPGYTPQGWLEELVRSKADIRWPEGVPPKVQALLEEEFRIIGHMGYAAYFLTVHDIVQFAQAKGILCQGRGSAANSAVCFVLGITAVDPAKHSLLFSRFISEERKEPPDIDVDFEHERREEVMQYVYARYGRNRAGIVATINHFRPKSALREVGKALGLSEDITSRLASTVWGSYSSNIEPKRFSESGFAADNPEIFRLNHFVQAILTFPRHLSQHVGGFVLSEERLDGIVPIQNAAMPDRTFIEWDKDDIDALGLMKVDVLALGMLTCIRKAFDMIAQISGIKLTLDSLPDHDEAVWDMLCAGDSIGVFQVESRAQINMLPRLRPRCFYDLAIQVAIVRPGPIQGDMVHPYLQRRQGKERVEFPSPKPPHDPNELREVLGKTLGVPLFQEQAMKLAIVAADFTPSESNQLRRAMATFRNLGTIDAFHEKLVRGMVARGYEAEFAERCFNQIEGFGSYGFPESHAIAFARLVWVSSWIKHHYPAVFAAALLNAQPMGFYAPAQIVGDAAEHGVEVRGPDVNFSNWDSSLEGSALRLGLRQIDGVREDWAQAIVATRPFAGIEALARQAKLPSRALRLLADADALRSLGIDRREGAWEVRRTPVDELPLFAAANARALGVEPDSHLPQMPLSEHVVVDYQMIRLSLKAHPMQFLRERFAGEGVLSCAATAASRNGALVKTAGIVLVRQRPGKGNAIFVTLEDESGITNVVIWARRFERYRRQVMAARLMLVEGEVQRSPEGVIHLMANRIHDRSEALLSLSQCHELNPTVARADVVKHPLYPRHSGRSSGHPRNVRIIPKSRDFH